MRYFGHKFYTVVSHILFWILAYVFFIIFFGRANRDYTITIIFATLLFPLSIGITYFINYFLIPRYLFAKKYGKFILFLFYAMVYSVWLELMITLFVFVIISNYEMYKMDPASFDAVLLIVGMYFIIIIATAILLARNSFEIQKKNASLHKIRYKTELKLKEAELKLLKAQIHPHFLFNTLNNIYGLTLEKSDGAPDLVLRFSEILDYILYRCDETKVPLSEEIKNLKNYVEIEKIRYSEKLKLSFLFPEITEGLKIAPLLLLPFVENAFKHGVSNQPENGEVSIDIKLANKTLDFAIANSKPMVKQPVESKGIGLSNVRKRLELLYNDKFNLAIDDKNEIYSVFLTIELED